MILAGRVPVEQPAQERDERDALELRATSRVLPVVARAKQRLEPVRVAECLCRQRRDDLTEANIALGERLGLALGPEEDRADDRRAPSNRHDDDRAHVAHVECGARVLEHRVVRRVRNEHRIAGLERPLELRVALEVHHECPTGRVLVAGPEADVSVAASQIDRATIQAERLAQLAGDRLENVYEVEGRRDVLQDVDDGDELVTFAFQLRDPLLQPGGLRIRWGIALDR